MIRMLVIFLCCVFPAWLFAAGGPQDFEYGARPPTAVFDPDDLLDEETENRLAAALAKTRADDKADVLVVVMKDLGQAPAGHVAKRFAIAWCEGPMHAVVLHVPGRADGPWIVPGGAMAEAINPELVRTSVEEAVRRAAQEPKDPDKVRAAALEASDMLRFWSGGAVIRSEQISERRALIRKDLESRSLSWRVRLFLITAACLTLLAILTCVVFLLRRKKPGVFGAPQMPRRLGAPYCGGNHAVISLGPPIGNKPDAGNSR